MAIDKTGPDGRPVVGHTLRFFREPLEFRRRCTERYGDVVPLSVLGRDVFFLSHPDHVESVLVGRNEDFSRLDSIKKRLEPSLGHGLLNNDGEFWKRQRRLMQPAFHPRRVETEYAEVMREEAEEYLERWQHGETYDVQEEMRTLVLRVLVRNLLGDDVSPRRVGEALDDIREKRIFLPGWVPAPSNHRFKRGLNELESVIYDVIDRRRDEPDEGYIIDHMVQAETADGTAMTAEEIRDEVVTLLFAGHDTSALSLSFTLHLLARNQEVQSRLASELDSTLDGRPPSVEDLDDLELVDRVYKEALRLYPPAYDIRRQTNRRMSMDGHEIPEGAMVVVSPWGLHRDGRWYDDPGQFRPDRWTDDFESELPSGAYIPFGAGPHLCIGRQFGLTDAKLILATLFQQYHLELVSEEPLDLVTSVTIEPTNDLDVVVRER